MGNLNTKNALRLNPLGIGEGFEQTRTVTFKTGLGLNPLGIGEGFELENHKKVN